MHNKSAEMDVETRHSIRGGTGAIGIRHLFKQEDFTARVRLCALMTLPPGASVGEHVHEGEDELYAFLKGSGMLNDGRTSSRVEAGDATLTRDGESHSLVNDGAEDLEVLAVIVTRQE